MWNLNLVPHSTALSRYVSHPFHMQRPPQITCTMKRVKLTLHNHFWWKTCENTPFFQDFTTHKTWKIAKLIDGFCSNSNSGEAIQLVGKL